MTHALKLTVCRLMMGVLLFAQMSVAAYACPGMSSALAPVGSLAGDAGPDSAALEAALVDAAALPHAIAHRCFRI